ncbi:MAG TPA: hypothetical protein VIG31_03865 [Rhodanobacteraceae bacterium]
MNYKIAAATLVLACAFGSAGCSHNAGDQQAGTPSAASAQPPYTSTGTAATTGAAGTARMAGAASTAGGMSTAGSAAAPSTSFDDLAGSKGYIRQEDAGRDAWLSGHFSGCDSNNDGKLTRQEYAQCMQKNGNAAEGVPPASSTH